MRHKDRVRLLAAVLASIAVVVPLGLLWWSSLPPSAYSVMDMGYADYGGGPHDHAMGATADGSGAGGTVSVADLTEHTSRPADVLVHLVARKQSVRLADGRLIDGYTLNGSTPGPQITVTVGQLVEVHVHNESVPDGITVHWHGVDVPNAEDGVAGVTQDAIPVGGDFTYRFAAPHVGTYWYHSHQVSHEQVAGGLFGALVVLPKHPERDVRDFTALAHSYDGIPTVNGRPHGTTVEASPGQTVRVRLVNTDNVPLLAWSDAAYRLVAVDGYAVHDPGTVTGRTVEVPAGGRADVQVTAPADGSATRVNVGPSTWLTIGPAGATSRPVPVPDRALDLLAYGTSAPLPFDPGKPDRRFVYDIGRRVGLMDGKPGFWWTVNGHLFPDMPMFVVRRRDVVLIRISNHSGVVHPMHLHGHHAVVLARNGVRSTGSPWWVDSLDVDDGDSYQIAFLADNPGIWMDHCHNLEHATQGLVTHLMYEGVTEPFRVGGPSHNHPE
ncbi:MAG TPA: multicopper oxidase family protein [Nocardioidaceae bacterium]|nr:multicopper oxidase family protein [Nocardioidaceae bacterium]